LKLLKNRFGGRFVESAPNGTEKTIQNETVILNWFIINIYY